MQDSANLQVTPQARVVALAVYRATSAFPKDERFGLTAQMRRAAISIGSNIAEGCGRDGDRELVRFLQIAMGSASELEFQAQIANDLGFLSEETATTVLNEISRAKRMLARLITTLRASK